VLERIVRTNESSQLYVQERAIGGQLAEGLYRSGNDVNDCGKRGRRELVCEKGNGRGVMDDAKCGILLVEGLI